MFCGSEGEGLIPLVSASIPLPATSHDVYSSEGLQHEDDTSSSGGLNYANANEISYQRFDRNPNEEPEEDPCFEARYRECLRNHAASIGGHALDGCGEFMAGEEDPLKCAACGRHRNFHRRVSEGDGDSSQHFGCCCRKRVFLPCYNMTSPQIASGLVESNDSIVSGLRNRGICYKRMKKRFRTKFSQDQKEKMHVFAEKMGWRMQKQDDAVVQQFCKEIGVSKGVLKVWMHNNKHALVSAFSEESL